jgi:hypothetical protein
MVTGRDCERVVAPGPADPRHAAPTTVGRRRVARRSGARVGWVVLASYAVLSFAYFLPTWRDPGHRLIGSAGDPSLFVWYFRWVPWAIAHGHNPLFSSYVNAPHGVNLMWNTAVLLPGLLLSPVTALFGPIVTYNLLTTTSLALSGWAAWLAFRRVCRLRWGAWVGGLLFEFSPFLVAQSRGHLHLTAAFLVPLLALAVHEVLIEQRCSARRGGLALGVLAAAQALTGEELLAIAGVALVVGAVVVGLLHRRQVVRRARHAIEAGLWASGAFAAVAGGPLLFQFLGPQVVHGNVQPRDHYVADLWAWAMPSTTQWFHPFGLSNMSHRFQSIGAEWCAYLGAPILLLLAVVIVRRRRDLGLVAAGLTLLVITVLAFGPHLRAAGHKTGIAMPWDAVGGLPLLESLLPVRLMMAADFILAGLVGIAAETAWRARAGWRRRAAVGALALAVVPGLPRPDFPSVPVTVPPFFTSPAVRSVPAGSLAVIAPYPEPRNVFTLRWQLATGLRYRMAGGYALVPGDRGNPTFTGPLTATELILDDIQNGVPSRQLDLPTVVAMRREMVASKAATVMVGPMAHRDQAVALFSALLRAAPVDGGGVAMWTDVPSMLAR